MSISRSRNRSTLLWQNETGLTTILPGEVAPFPPPVIGLCCPPEMDGFFQTVAQLAESHGVSVERVDEQSTYVTSFKDGFRLDQGFKIQTYSHTPYVRANREPTSPDEHAVWYLVKALRSFSRDPEFRPGDPE